MVSLVDHFPATEEIQRAQAMTVQGGGRVATAMVTLARLGANVAMLDQSCGDSYHGAFLFGLLKGMELEQVASPASAVAALNSQHLGGQTGLPTFEQVKAFLASRTVVG